MVLELVQFRTQISSVPYFYAFVFSTCDEDVVPEGVHCDCVDLLFVIICRKNTLYDLFLSQIPEVHNTVVADRNDNLLVDPFGVFDIWLVVTKT